MTKPRPKLRLFLDEGVPDSVAKVFEAAGHDVILLRNNLATGSPDQLVCAAAEINQCILVALDGDMRKLAQRRGVGQRRYRKLSLIKLSCLEPNAAARVNVSMSLIEHEWAFSAGDTDRRIFIEISDSVIKTNR